MAGGIGRVAPCAGFKAVLLHENAALGQRLRMADDRADGLQRCTRHRQQILPDGQVTHAGDDDVRVGVQQIQHGGHIARIGVFKRKYAELRISALHSIKDLAPGGAGRLPRKGEQALQCNLAPCAGHPLIGSGVAAKAHALIRAGNGHRIIQKSAIVGAQRLIGDAGRIFIQHSRLTRGVKHRLAGLGLIARHIGHRAHPPLKQGGHLRVNSINLCPGLL